MNHWPVQKSRQKQQTEYKLGSAGQGHQKASFGAYLFGGG